MIVTILTGGLAIIVYIAMAFIVPEADGECRAGRRRAERRPGPRAGTAGAAATTSHDRADRLGLGGPDRRGRRGRHGRATAAAAAAIVVGLILVLVGAFLLIRQFVPAVDLSLVWPIASIAFGVLLVILSVRPKRPA